MTEIDHNVGMYSAQLGHYQRDNSECEAKRSRILSCHDDKHTPPNCVRSVKPGGYEYYNTPLESPVHTRETNTYSAFSDSQQSQYSSYSQHSPASVSDVTSTGDQITQEWPSIYNKSNDFNNSGNSTHKLGLVCMDSNDIPYSTDSMA